MILRRLATAVREQNWTAVLLEILVVVVGLFLGLQVDDWNRQRNDRTLERQYLERLHEETKAAVSRQRDAERWNGERLRTQEVVLGALRAGVLREDQLDDFQEGLALSGSLNPLVWHWGVVQELNSTGRIDLLRDTQVRDLIGQTEIQFRRFSEIVRVANSAIGILRGQVARRFDAVAYGFGIDDEVRVDFDFDAISSDGEFIAAFSNLHLESARVVTFARRHLEALERLEAGIAAARGVAPMPEGP